MDADSLAGIALICPARVLIERPGEAQSTGVHLDIEDDRDEPKGVPRRQRQRLRCDAAFEMDLAEPFLAHCPLFVGGRRRSECLRLWSNV